MKPCSHRSPEWSTCVVPEPFWCSFMYGGLQIQITTPFISFSSDEVTAIWYIGNFHKHYYCSINYLSITFLTGKILSSLQLSLCQTQPPHLHRLQKANILDFMVSKATSWMSPPTGKRRLLSILTGEQSSFSVMIAKNSSKQTELIRKKWNSPARLARAERFRMGQKKASRNITRECS